MKKMLLIIVKVWLIKSIVNLLIKEIQNLHKITEDQINLAKTYVINKGIQSILTNQSKCFALGRQALVDDNHLDLDGDIYQCQNITHEDIMNFCKKYLNKPADKISKILNE